jgi:hypothetical protein
MSKPEAVHCAWHMNVCEHNSDVAAAFQYPYRFISAGSFNDLKARIFDHIAGTYTNQRLIFNDEHHWHSCATGHALHPTLAATAGFFVAPVIKNTSRFGERSVFAGLGKLPNSRQLPLAD